MSNNQKPYMLEHCPSCGVNHVKDYQYCTKIRKKSDKSPMKMRTRKPDDPFYMRDHVLFFEYTERNDQGNLITKESPFAYIKDKQLAEQIVTRYNFFTKTGNEDTKVTEEVAELVP